MLVNLWEGGDAREEAAAYCERWSLGGTVLLDESSEYARAVGVRGVPTNVFVDETGIVRAVGATTSEELLACATLLEPGLVSIREEILAADRNPFGFVEEDEDE